MSKASPEMESYFDSINQELKKAYAVANQARAKGYDPETKVDIPLALNMAERVEGLISAAAPQIIGSGVAARIEELEKKYGALAWEVALKIAEEVADEKFCKFSSKKEAMEMGIRTGFAYHTVGVVSAPLEGFIELRIKKRRDGKEYVAASYAGPIRGAGGTAAAFSLILTDYIRKRHGYSTYDPDENEAKRFVSELEDYHERIANLQYHASPEEIEFLVKNLPVEIDGEPSEKIEVSNYKDLPRINTNLIRSGVCLVTSMVALKAPKIWKELQKWQKDFDIDWSFLEQYIKLQKSMKAKEGSGSGEKSLLKIKPDYTYISDLVAGRPVLTYPLRLGGFRLRYGRSRTSGFSCASMHPATMRVLDNYIAIGTQLKLERPGKAAAITSCNSIEGPIVKLVNGDVIRVETEKEAKQLTDTVTEILFLGDILICYGDFFDRAHLLVPPGYCEEWHIRELEKAMVDLFGSYDIDKLSELVEVSKEELVLVLKNPFTVKPSAKLSIQLSKKLSIPLHPRYTYYWNAISFQELIFLMHWFQSAKMEKKDSEITKIVLPADGAKRVIELIGLPHRLINKEYVVIEKDDAMAIAHSLGIELTQEQANQIIEQNKQETALAIVNLLSGTKIRDKGGTFIGARMGRPEKAKMRKLTGGPQVLFPVGDQGGRLRCFQSAMEAGKVTADFQTFRCRSCSTKTIYPVCERCGKPTQKIYNCKICGEMEAPCQHPNTPYKRQDIDIKNYFNSALEILGTKTYPDLVKGVRGTSNKEHVPEHLSKGILRAKHSLHVNKDGTIRYDMTELPITHFKPKEIRTSVERLVELGYTKDINSQLLQEENQILELKPQDIILPSGQESTDEVADEILFRTAQFVDDLLAGLYKQEPYYLLKDKNELIGQLVIGIAPHISAGMIGRIIGFSKNQSMLAHPLYHAAMRRDCDGDEACVILLMDALLNFSRKYLPDSRGAKTMDAPLVMTATLVPAEVDDMVQKMDVAWNYPLELYEAAMQYKLPWEVKIAQLGERLNTEKQYEQMGYTHDTDNINSGVLCSAYKTLPSMEEKLKGQMRIAEKLRAVDTSDVAKLVIEKHFIKDIKGNLRKFSTQQFRCVKCNKKFRRPPLMGQCDECSGKIIFTISKGSIIKYLAPAISLAEKYAVSPYLMQTLQLTKQRVEDLFGRDAERQEGLGKWFQADKDIA